MGDRRSKLERIHLRILAGDPSASADLFLSVHGPLCHVLLKTFWAAGINEEDASDLATDAVLEYLAKPTKFNPALASLFTFLAVIARGDGLNKLKKKSNEIKGQEFLFELLVSDGNMREDGSEMRMDALTLLNKYGHQVVETEADEAVLRLMLMGEGATQEYAKALGIAHASEVDQKAAVKKYRDKIEKRLRRIGEQL